ncbi:phosphodiester glycosidase family protein [Kitasatospora sp. A2-31]|uniref:phosphodiester glycosidase family protein n=1 Tax=Kitasatospora sp. A2-31 TaxID=2916414 RepID=UPI001EEF2690|nr:phosphodiester glycosidase family protein [Kitasatospora sp. A2-31]MCG6499942.1 phosphodiester glycosidase family protein [Kitasatospora sp. A2-31]
MRSVTSAAAALALVSVALGSGSTAHPAVAAPAITAPAGSAVVREQVAPGVVYEAFTVPTAQGSARVHVVTADLERPGVAADLLYPGAVAARKTVSRMAEEAGALAAINGDFFDITEEQHPGVQATGAASGPSVLNGRPLKGAVPTGQRFGRRKPPGDTAADVFGVGVDGRARMDRLVLHGHIRTPQGELVLGGLNQYALPVDSIGAFTSRWGEVSRARAACGTDDDRAAPCTSDTYEVTIRHGRIATVSDAPGTGPIDPDTTVLLGREAGARALRALVPGALAAVDYRLASRGPVPFAFALGARPLIRDHRPLPGLDTVTAVPRTAIGTARGGRLLRLLSTDGRGGTSTGLTLSELAGVLHSLDCAEASYLDGGGSATIATRAPATGRVVVRNNLDHDRERPVPNGIAILPARR